MKLLSVCRFYSFISASQPTIKLPKTSTHHYYTSIEPSLYTLSELMGNESPKKKTPSTIENEPQGLCLQSLLKESLASRLTDSNRSNYQKILEQTMKNPVKDRALGCLFGAFIGDALGSYCQFSKSISDNLIDLVMTMPGGGVFDLQPGQLTDDSQLTVHLLQGLNKMDTSLPFCKQEYTLIKHIAEEYVNWMESQPFDIGITCRNGISQIKAHKHRLTGIAENQIPVIFDKIYSEVANENKDSESNGSLMRITPMALLFSCTQLHPLDHAQFIQNEIRLIHSKKVIHTASYLWVNTLTRIIQRDNDKPITFKEIFDQIQAMDSERHLQDWFEVAKKQQRMNGTIKIGWAKIAWSYGMRQLYRLGRDPQSFEQGYYKRVIRQVIKEAGDTDTNACIVGGLLGALVGFSRLPPWYIKKMMEINFSNQQLQVSRARPSHYEPFKVLLLALNFIEKCSNYKEKSLSKA